MAADCCEAVATRTVAPTGETVRRLGTAHKMRNN